MSEEDKIKKLEEAIVRLGRIAVNHEKELKKLQHEVKIRDIDKLISDINRRVGDSYA